MKGATEVPSTITVIIIQYTLIKRMKYELAFPISPTYSLNFKYSSHGPSQWKHTGTVGISHMATTASTGVEEWRDLKRRVKKSWQQHKFRPQNLAQAFWEDRAWICCLTLTPSRSPVSFLAQGCDLLSQPQGCSAVGLLWTLNNAPLKATGISHTPEEWVRLSSKEEKV